MTMMKEATVLTIAGEKITLKEDGALGELESRVRGEIILPSDGAKFDDCRVIWNAAIDRKPGLIVVCTGNADVVQCVKFAKEHSIMVTVRGGGHNIAGKALADCTMLIDLSKWRNVHVDAAKKIASISPGATLGDIDHETKEFGLVLPVGINSTTGISGLTLGGGFGWISRKFGMTIDSLVSANVVIADGTTIRCDEHNASDLFWAIRGGGKSIHIKSFLCHMPAPTVFSRAWSTFFTRFLGGNFGIVTNFSFHLHNVGPMVTAGPIVFPLEEATTVLNGLARIGKMGDEDLTAWSVFRQAPPFPFVPGENHFHPVLIVAVCFVGDAEAADAAIDPIMKLGNVLGHGVGRVPFAAWQQAFDALLTPGFRNYWKTNNFHSLEPEMIEALVEKAHAMPNFGTEIFVAQLGGFIARVDPSKTAYAHRGVEYLVNCHTRWIHPEEDAENIAFARDLFDTLAPYSDGTTYSNFVSDGDENAKDVYGANLARLAEVKTKYDPENFFSVNYNILPKA
jgi:FAD/FMN-containing dehydrogenase